jgi:uncharacterized Zn finger protein (UPF0148 family)
MKVCEDCGTEICTKDGENKCPSCDSKERKSKKAKLRRQEREQMMRDCGLVKVKGALGGTYWE